MPKKPELPGVDALFSRPSAIGGPPGTQPSATQEPEVKPVKFTFYFSPETLQALEEAWFELRRRTGRRISKSEIVDTIVRTSLQDLDKVEHMLT
ncbi:MAG: hypothetical protein H5T86_00355 [Armatimonadetes bacterium]|nr:hypothetical protein [Armatimonadota bacterium]